MSLDESLKGYSKRSVSIGSSFFAGANANASEANPTKQATPVGTAQATFTAPFVQPAQSHPSSGRNTPEIDITSAIGSLKLDKDPQPFLPFLYGDFHQPQDFQPHFFYPPQAQQQGQTRPLNNGFFGSSAWNSFVPEATPQNDSNSRGENSKSPASKSADSTFFPFNEEIGFANTVPEYGRSNFPKDMPVGPNMWNKHPMMPQYENNQNFNRRYRAQGDGMNVHRKMHNHTRRKGDDASKYANCKLEDFAGEIYNLCKDQHGCRFLQRQLEGGSGNGSNGSATAGSATSAISATLIFNEIYLKIVELMTDPFGNYLIQKLFENVSTDQRIILVKNSAPEFIRIALDPHGTRALQKLVECVTTDEEAQLIISSLSPYVVSLSRDLNGNHVVQKCLQKLQPNDNQFIFAAAAANCVEIATHRHGCCVLQRCLDHGNFEQRSQLSLKVAENATALSVDPFGNYVVQYVLARGDDASIAIIVNHIKANVVALSLHKFGSNVIEKSLRISSLSNGLIDVLLARESSFAEMLNDAFGNYVLQTALDVASQEDLARLSSALQPLLPNIKNTPHGRRIMTKIQSL